MTTRPALAFFLALAPLLADGAERWVDARHPNASDQNPGTRALPWATVSKAAAAAEPGDLVIIRPGIYREHVVIKRPGEPGRPITFRAEGPGVVVSGADRLTAWSRCTPQDCPDNPNSAHIWKTRAAWQPKTLFQDGRPLRPARQPNSGWWTAQGGGTHTIADPAHLTGKPERWVGATVAFWDVDVTTQCWRKVLGFDPRTHALRLDGPIWRDRVVEPGRDRYRVANKLEFLDQPGEFVATSDGDATTIYLWPLDDADPNTALIEAPRRSRFVIETAGKSHLRFDGLEIRHGAGHGIGTWTKTSADIQILHCHVHHNLGNGIYLTGMTDVVVRGNLVADNANGLTAGHVRNLTVEANEIANNRFDGLVVSHDSADITIRRNYIHGHDLWGHPDNIQFHNRVRNVRIIENVIVHSGQAIMMEQCEDGLVQGNVIAGTGAVAVIHGHSNVRRFKLVGNTIAFAGYGCISFTGTDYELVGNILYPGCPSTCYSVGDPRGFRADWNLLYKPPGLGGPFTAFARNWPRDFQGHRKVSGQDAHSICADPQFLNAPVAAAQIDNRRLLECTTRKLFVRGAEVFKVGDIVEVRFDGVPRRVAAVGRDFIVIAPPLAEPLEKAGLVLNWKDKRDFALDLRTAPTSPARGAGPDDTDIGAKLDIQAFARGDTDGDGKPDIRRAGK